MNESCEALFQILALLIPARGLDLVAADYNAADHSLVALCEAPHNK